MNYLARILNSVLSSKAQCQQLVDERGDGCTTNSESEGSKHQRDSSPLKQSNHQVSYLAVSGGDSKGVHYVGALDGEK